MKSKAELEAEIRQLSMELAQEMGEIPWGEDFGAPFAAIEELRWGQTWFLVLGLRKPKTKSAPAKPSSLGTLISPASNAEPAMSPSNARPIHAADWRLRYRRRSTKEPELTSRESLDCQCRRLK